MWEGLIKRPLDFWTAGRFLAFVSAFLAAAFAYLLVAAPIAQADDHHATWNQSNLIFEGNTYEGPRTAGTNDSRNLPEGTVYYFFEEGGQLGRSGHLIYFPPDTDVSSVDSAQYQTYTRRNSDYRNFSEPREITIDTTTSDQANPEFEPGGGDPVDSCALEGGLGWILCPLTNTMARGMDWVFDRIANFLIVEPLSDSSSRNAMFEAWKIMRNIANFAFVISFLIIIYSQVTSLGISNYGIKRLFPRLIIAAILVNISYLVCMIAIDISNILGMTLQGMFIDMRNYIVGDIGTETSMIVSWESVTAGILAGGTLAGVAIGGTVLSLANVSMAGGGAFFLLFPILVTALLTLLVVLLILAARQAIITILVVLSPLAFVAYLLPNTESWFEKWRSVFTTMLLLFPAFSIVFGGSQLAGLLIIINAIKGGDITTLLLGMAVQVAPLAIVPLLLKLGGTLLTRIAGIVNSPNKGLIDRTRNWSNGHFDRAKADRMAKSRTMAHEDPKRFRRSPLRQFGVHWDDVRRAREGKQKVDEQMADAMFINSDLGHGLHRAEHSAHTAKEQAETSAKEALQKGINVVGSDLHIQQAKLEGLKANLEIRNTETSALMDEYRSGKRTAAGELGAVADDLQRSDVILAATKDRVQSAGKMRNENIAQAFTDTSVAAAALRRMAAGVDPAGEVRAEANAETALTKMEAEALGNNVTLLKARALRQGTSVKLYSQSIVEDALAAASRGDVTENPTIVKAALQAQAEEGNMEIFERVRGSENFDQKDVWEIIQSNTPTFKSKGGFHIQANPTLSAENLGKAEYERQLRIKRMDTLGNTNADGVKDLKVGWLSNVAKNIHQDIAAAKAAGNMRDLEKAYNNMYVAVHNPDVLKDIGDREEFVKTIENAFNSNGVPLTLDPDVIKMFKPE